MLEQQPRDYAIYTFLTMLFLPSLQESGGWSGISSHVLLTLPSVAPLASKCNIWFPHTFALGFNSETLADSYKRNFYFDYALCGYTTYICVQAYTFQIIVPNVHLKMVVPGVFTPEHIGWIDSPIVILGTRTSELCRIHFPD